MLSAIDSMKILCNFAFYVLTIIWQHRKYKKYQTKNYPMCSVLRDHGKAKYTVCTQL